MKTFTAHCQKGHDRLEFTDPATFEAHVRGEHGARTVNGGGPAWCNPKPFPWKAPPAPKTTDKLEATFAKWNDPEHKTTLWLQHWGYLPYGEPLVGCEEPFLPEFESAA